jgi:hypothetical protein
MMSFPLEGIMSDSPDSLGPKTREYVKMIRERPAYKRVSPLLAWTSMFSPNY